ncbi:MAG: hypothetical protein R2774_05015 [Saprospiraceae bacterium]
MSLHKKKYSEHLKSLPVLLTQDRVEEIVAWLKKDGTLYKKVTKVYARKCITREKTITITSSGIETVNIASSGDYIIKNQTTAGESYILKEKIFLERYQFNREIDDTWSEYEALGKIYARSITKFVLKQMCWPEKFLICTQWGENMVCQVGDCSIKCVYLSLQNE